MRTVGEIAERLGLTVLTGGEALEREVSNIFCCDLLSFVIGRAPEDCAWVTVMGNVNVIAVATLADAACTVLAEGTKPDADAVAKAAETGCALLLSDLPVYETAKAIDELIG